MKKNKPKYAPRVGGSPLPEGIRATYDTGAGGIVYRYDRDGIHETNFFYAENGVLCEREVPCAE